MTMRLFASGLVLASALCLGGCPQAPAPADDAADQAAGEVGAAIQESAGAGSQLMAGTVTARLGASQETVMVASVCEITNEGANGRVVAEDGAFELTWSDGVFRLNWARGDTAYQGDVTGSVQAGGGLSFEGEANGVRAQGFAVCLNM
jgi:hypothetical protein